MSRVGQVAGVYSALEVAASGLTAERGRMNVIASNLANARTTKGAERRSEHGIIAPVRTYESPIDRRLEDAGFDSIASVTLLMKETLVRVAEPALVPAGVR